MKILSIYINRKEMRRTISSEGRANAKKQNEGEIVWMIFHAFVPRGGSCKLQLNREFY